MNRPLQLPPGSVRAILALIAIGGSVGLVYVGIGVPEWLIGIDGTIVALYFEARRNGQ